MTRKLKVSKLDAARRQIDTAIALWFDGGDPVAVHTLTAAAHELVHALYKKRGLHDLLFDSDWIKDEHRKQWSDKIRANANFFKHADRDAEAELEFDTSLNDLHILYTLVGLHRMEEEMTEIENVFMHRLGIEYPNLLKEDRYAKTMSPEALAAIKATSRTEFLTVMRKAAALRKATEERNLAGKRVRRIPSY